MKLKLLLCIIFVLNIHASESLSKKLAIEYIKIAKVKETFDETIKASINQTLRQDPTLEYQEVEEYFNKYMGWDSMEEIVINLTIEAFTDQELKDVINFFKTPSGKAFANKSPWLSKELVKKILEKNVQYVKKTNLDDIDKKLNEVSNEANKGLPQLVDADTRIDSTQAINKHFITSATLVNYKSEEIDPNKLEKIVLESLTDKVCTRDNYKLFRKHNIITQYDYYGKNGKKILTVKINPKDC